MRATDETLRLDLDDLKYIITLIIVQRILLNSIEQSTRFNNSERKHFREKYEEINLNKIISASVVAKRKRAPCVQDGIQIVPSSQINRQGRVFQLLHLLFRKAFVGIAQLFCGHFSKS